MAAAPYWASMDSGRPLSERKLAAMFGKTTCPALGLQSHG